MLFPEVYAAQAVHVVPSKVRNCEKLVQVVPPVPGVMVAEIAVPLQMVSELGIRVTTGATNGVETSQLYMVVSAGGH